MAQRRHFSRSQRNQFAQSSRPGEILNVEEKFGEQNFRVFSEMRGKNWYYNPKKLKKSCQNRPKCKQNAVKI